MTTLGATVLGAVALAGCGADSGTRTTSAKASSPVEVVAGFYPLEEAAKAIGGPLVHVTDLTPPGGEPHGLELTPDRLVQLQRADVALYLGNGFQPEVEKAAGSLPEGARAVDLLDGLRLRRAETGIPGVRGEVEGGRGEALSGGKDPHVWVDPELFVTMARAVERALIAADPQQRTTFTANADRYIAGLQNLDEEFATTLKTCRRRVLVASHAAFGYLTDRYGLTQAAIAGITPEEEPDPASLAALARYAKQQKVGTVFFETLVPKRLSQTLAAEIGARTDALNPVEGLTEPQIAAGATYSSLQRDNLARLRRGLQCTD